MGRRPSRRSAGIRRPGLEDPASRGAPPGTATGNGAPSATLPAGGRRFPPWLAVAAASVPVRVAALALLVVVAYGGALGAGVAWDDTYLISANPAIRTLERPWRFFTDASTLSPNGGTDLAQYRPLRTLAYALQFAIFGGNAWGFHLVSILLHALVGWLVGTLALTLFGRGGWLAATIWLLHPAVSENVLYLAAQGNLLCLVSALAATISHLRWLETGSNRYRGAAVVSACAAMAAYEFGVVLPALLVIAEAVWLWGGRTSTASPLRRHAPYWLALGAFLALRAAVAEPSGERTWWAGSWTAALLHQLGLWAEGWRLTLLPVAQKVRYFPTDVPEWAPAPIAVLLHLALAALVARAVLTGRGRLPAACIAWWYMAQAPTSNLLVSNPGFMLAPRFLFLALVLPVAATAAWISGRRLPRWWSAAAAAAALAAIVLVRHQAGVWQSPITLNRAIVAAEPRDFGGQYVLGFAYFMGGETVRVRQQLAIARSIAPEFARIYLILGEVELREGHVIEAHAAYRRYLELEPGPIEPKLRLAEISAAVGQRQAALDWMATIGGIERRDPCSRARAELALARVEAALGRRDAIGSRVDRALASWSHTSDVLFQSGALLVGIGQRERGLEVLRRAAEQAGRDYAERVGDFAWLNMDGMRPLLPLTPDVGFASVLVPKVGP